MKNVLYVLIGVMAGFVLAGVLVFVSRAPTGNPITLQPAPTDAPIAVHVIGAVPRPGLYEFPKGARIQDAIEAAGGLLTSANADTLNLAALLEDGAQLDIPYKTGQEPAIIAPTLELPSSTTLLCNPDLININTADQQTLISLGFGTTGSHNILEYIKTNGYFTDVAQLENVAGVFPSTVADLKDKITACPLN